MKLYSFCCNNDCSGYGKGFFQIEYLFYRYYPGSCGGRLGSDLLLTIVNFRLHKYKLFHRCIPSGTVLGGKYLRFSSACCYLYSLWQVNYCFSFRLLESPEKDCNFFHFSQHFRNCVEVLKLKNLSSSLSLRGKYSLYYFKAFRLEVSS